MKCMKFKPGDYVRIRTMEEVIKDKRRIVGKSAFMYWGNSVCVVCASRLVPPMWQYRIKLVDDSNNKWTPDAVDRYWWYEYEIEEYEVHEIADEAYEALIGGVQ